MYIYIYVYIYLCGQNDLGPKRLRTETTQFNRPKRLRAETDQAETVFGRNDLLFLIYAGLYENYDYCQFISPKTKKEKYACKAIQGVFENSVACVVKLVNFAKFSDFVKLTKIHKSLFNIVPYPFLSARFSHIRSVTYI